ncbi:MAG: radical SAM protein [Desulfomonile tiedjei]|uniref:FeMo cofactor biosynthesis protein NifB n=1 Tax=Desulfomonile tiedjei TaxID=2358 RepID=A0A9D6V203_9BACT|nr:radical SAM protein [Desulfomonile tiedjei]
MSAGLDTSRHPCFNVEAKGKCGRVHLPVAPDCNIKCNYCNRKYDCVNESRPGVTSCVLTPKQAIRYLERVLEKAPNITVAGIAGPGDAFANPDLTMEALRLIRERFPDLLLCLATNGLNLSPYVKELAEWKVSHVTVTVNAVDPAIGARVYSWVRDRKVIYRQRDAAELLLKRQLEGIAALKAHGITVKVNTIVIPGINDSHVMEVSRKMAEMGVDIQNCMTMYPNSGTVFADIPEPSQEQMALIRAEAENILPQMKHCTRCRADAVGLLEKDMSAEFRDCMSGCASGAALDIQEKPYVAAATFEGVLVNQHLGEAEVFQIWGKSENGYAIIDERKAPGKGTGIQRWMELAELLKDCRAVLVNGIGETPYQALIENDILPVEMSGFIVEGLEAVYNGRNVASLKGRRNGCSKGTACSGSGGGCG